MNEHLTDAGATSTTVRIVHCVARIELVAVHVKVQVVGLHVSIHRVLVFEIEFGLGAG